MMNLNFVTIFIFFFITIKDFSRAELTEIVQTQYGPVQGDVLTTVQEELKYSSFKGIPYARPPVGKYRFQPPQPPNSWTEILCTQQDSNPCPQLDKSSNVIGDEDCLYLNVYTPELELSAPKKLRAVMVWIHGGGFIQGSANSSFFGPDFLVEKDVVVVAMNYRLGALGFLTLGNEMISGNAGLKDQALAIKWVNENIEKFAGDPNKITIFGESAGSVSIEFHHLSPLSRGLFRASIAMSGSSLNPWGFLNLAKATSRSIQSIQSNIISEFDANSTEDISKLYEVPFEQFALLDDYSFVSLDDISFVFAPTAEVEGTQNQPFLTDEPLSIYQSGDFYHVPHILGYMNDEALSLEILIELGYADNITASDKFTLEQFRIGINETRQYMIDSSPVPVYYYRNVFDYPESLHKVSGIHINGSAHADDIAYIFYVQGADQPLDPNNRASIFRNTYVTLWTNFAKCLVPFAILEDGDVLLWPPTDNAGLLLQMNSTFKILPNDD